MRQKHIGIAFGTALAAFCVAFVAQPAQAQLSVSAGGGWSAPRGDSLKYRQSGWRAQAGAELELGPNLGLELSGAYGNIGLNGSKLKKDQGLPPTDALESETSIYEITLAPKLYLMNRDIAAYVALGGGPRWLRETTTSGPGSGTTTHHNEQAWGVSAGFGADAAFSDDFRVGFTPMYQVVFADRGKIQYVSFVFYVKL
jgi:hypothetical protein